MDDSPDIREYNTLILQNAGYRVLNAEDGVAGLEAARATRFALVISDYHMPRMDGISLIAQLRALPGYADTPLFLLTADIDPLVQRDALRAGATLVLDKPLRAKTLAGLAGEFAPFPAGRVDGERPGEAAG